MVSLILRNGAFCTGRTLCITAHLVRPIEPNFDRCRLAEIILDSIDIHTWMRMGRTASVMLRAVQRQQRLIVERRRCGQVPSFRQQYLDGFTSRNDLLDAVLASAHIPFLLNWAPVAGMRGGWFLDGSLKDFLQCGSVLRHFTLHRPHLHASPLPLTPPLLPQLPASSPPLPPPMCSPILVPVTDPASQAPGSPPDSLLTCHDADLQVEEFRPANLRWRGLRGGLQPGSETSVAPITNASLAVVLCSSLQAPSCISSKSSLSRDPSVSEERTCL